MILINVFRTLYYIIKLLFCSMDKKSKEHDAEYYFSLNKH